MTDRPDKGPISLWGEARRSLRANRVAMACLVVICAYAALGLMDFIPMGWALGAPKASMVDFVFMKTVGVKDKNESYVAPSFKHPLGTDIHGTDVLYKAVKGIRTAIVLGGLTAAIYIPLGLIFGMIAGYFGGVVDDAIVYVYSTLACIPGILLLIALMTVMERGVYQLSIAMGITSWVGLCRLIRGQTLQLRESEYALAARALGASHARVMFMHLLPNLMHIVIITFTLGFGGVIMSEAVLSYLGIGVQPSTISWGMMINDAKMELSRDPSVWWQLTGAAGALFILVLALNVFGDALRDALDPKLRM